MVDPNSIDPKSIDCATACVNGCILGDRCPNREYAREASEFMQNVSLDDMHEIAEAALRKRASEPPKWVFPDLPSDRSV